jgi:tetratricopeptide (TPR) repeat protein
MGRRSWTAERAASKVCLERATPSVWEFEKASVLAHLGRRGEALALLEQALSVADLTMWTRGDLEAGRALVLAGLGRRKEALESIDRAIPLGKGVSHFHHAEYAIAAAYSLLGDRDRAREWLRSTAEADSIVAAGLSARTMLISAGTRFTSSKPDWRWDARSRPELLMDALDSRTARLGGNFPQAPRPRSRGRAHRRRWSAPDCG